MSTYIPGQPCKCGHMKWRHEHEELVGTAMILDRWVVSSCNACKCEKFSRR